MVSSPPLPAPRFLFHFLFSPFTLCFYCLLTLRIPVDTVWIAPTSPLCSGLGCVFSGLTEQPFSTTSLSPLLSGSNGLWTLCTSPVIAPLVYWSLQATSKDMQEINSKPLHVCNVLPQLDLLNVHLCTEIFWFEKSLIWKPFPSTVLMKVSLYLTTG